MTATTTPIETLPVEADDAATMHGWTDTYQEMADHQGRPEEDA